MFGNFNSVKTLKTLIKFAAVALTSPATVAVAGNLYSDHPITRVVVSLAALVLIEGCLLLGWQMLDQEGKNATSTQRWLYAGLAWVAYFSLFGIAIYHQEGIAGFAFRLTLGVMLIYASMEAGLLASIKVARQADRDIKKDRRVQRYARKLARKSAMADLDSEFRMGQIDREIKEQLYILRQSRETEVRVGLIETDQSLNSPKTVEMAKSVTSLDKANRTRRLSKRQALDRTLKILETDPEVTPAQIATEIGRSRQTVYDYFRELEEVGKISRNGKGITLFQP